MDKQITILGGGPGGYSAALVAAQKGLRVTLVEKDLVGGTCLNRGCIPTKALLSCSGLYSKIRDAGKFGIRIGEASIDIKAVMARKDKVVSTLRTGLEGILKKRGVRVVKARGTLFDNRAIEAGGEKIKGDCVIIATGTEVMRLWDGEGIITSDEALNVEHIPQKLLVAGAGAVGVEMACFFAELGSKVTLVELLPNILPGLDRELTDTLGRELKKKGILIRTSTKIEAISEKEVTFSDGKSAIFDIVLQAVGRRFNTESIGLENAGIKLEKGRIKVKETMETEIEGVYAIGDIAAGSPLLAHSAMEQGIVAALNCAGERRVMDLSLVPNCVYTHPEVASCGLTEEHLDNPLVAKIPYRVIGRAHASGEIAGLIKVVAEGKSCRIKGIHIAGEHATEIIHEGILAMKLNATIDQMGEVIRAHPTISELYSEAFHALSGRAIHFI